MTVLGGTVPITHVNGGGDTPAAARPDIKTAIDRVNDFIRHFGDSGFVSVSGTGPLNLGAIGAGVIEIGGSGTITGFGDPGARSAHRFLIFNSGITLQHNAGLLLPANQNIVTNWRDVAVIAWEEGNSRWRMRSYSFGQAQIATVAEIRAGTAANKVITVGRWQDAHAIVTLPDASVIAFNSQALINAQVTIAGNRVMGSPINRAPLVGFGGEIRILQTGGPHALSWASGWHFANREAPSLQPGENIFSYYHANASETWVAYGGGNFGST